MLYLDSYFCWKMSEVAFAVCMQTLQMLRPADHDIDAELVEIQKNARETCEESFWGSVRTLYSRRHCKQAVAALLIPWFQQFTGINSIMFYGEPPVFHGFLHSCFLALCTLHGSSPSYVQAASESLHLIDQ